MEGTMEEKQYTIREFSGKYQLPSSTLRYYEEVGLLTDVIHTESGRRLYTQKHVERLDGILCFKRAGMPISKMQDFYHYEENLPENIDRIIDLVSEHEKDLEQQIVDLEADLAHIRQKVYFYKEVKKALQEGREQPKWAEMFPPEEKTK